MSTRESVQQSGNWFHLPELFWVTIITHRENIFFPTAKFSLFYNIGVALALA